MDPLKYYKTPLTGKAKEQYDKNWDLIFANNKQNNIKIQNGRTTKSK